MFCLQCLSLIPLKTKWKEVIVYVLAIDRNQMTMFKCLWVNAACFICLGLLRCFPFLPIFGDLHDPLLWCIKSMCYCIQIPLKSEYSFTLWITSSSLAIFIPLFIIHAISFTLTYSWLFYRVLGSCRHVNTLLCCVTNRMYLMWK